MSDDIVDDGQTLFCPGCGARFANPVDVPRDANVIILCGLCGRAVPLAGAQQAAVADRASIDSGPRIVVGHEQPGACRTLAHVLRRGGYAPVCVHRGDLVIQACDPMMPARAHGVCLDVAIPGVMAFEVVAHLRSHPANAALPIILLASVFEKTRYKRRPSRLYGADAYLELHHVPDRLVEIIDALRANQGVGSDRNQAPLDRAEAAPLRSEVLVEDEDGVRVLARRVLSDVALYHGEEIARGTRRGDPLGELAGPIAEARERVARLAGPKDAATAFDAELDAFRARLSERERSRRAEHGA